MSKYGLGTIRETRNAAFKRTRRRNSEFPQYPGRGYREPGWREKLADGVVLIVSIAAVAACVLIGLQIGVGGMI